MPDAVRYTNRRSIRNLSLIHILLRFIKENKLGKVLPYQVQSGYGKYSAVAFDLEKLKAFDPKGVEMCIRDSP